MKKIVILFFLALSVTLKAGNPVSVVNGDVKVLKNAGKVLLEFDYSATKIEEKDVDTYLKGRGADVVRDWPSDNKECSAYFVKIFNKKNKNGIEVIENDNTLKYKLVIHVKNLDLGNTGAALFSFNAGGAIMDGTIDLIDTTTNTTVLSFKIDSFKAVGTTSEVMRRKVLYSDLAKYIIKSIGD